MRRPHRYSAAIRVPAPVGVGQAYAEMLAGATNAISIRSVTLTTTSNVGGEVSLERAFAIGTGAATGIATAIAHWASSPTPQGRLQVAWSSSGISPTGYVSYARHEVLPVATGQMRTLWSEDDGPFIVEPGSSALLVNHASGIAGGGMQVNVTWEEGPL